MDDEKIYCKICNEYYDINKFAKSIIRKDNTGVCKVCSWKKRHNNSIPKIDDVSIEITEYVLHCLFYNKETVLNDIADQLNLTLKQVISIVKALNLQNVKYKIKYECEYCGKKCYTNPQKYLENKHLYCSPNCYHKDKSSKMPKNKDSQFYNRIETLCANCGETIFVIPSQYFKSNQYGDNHNFCCQKCYWEYRGKYYRGEKGVHIEYTPEIIDKMRKSQVIRNQTDDRLNTSIQLKVNDMLDQLGIKYIREYNITYYSIDNYLIDSNLMIEVQGDYWHCNPLKYNNSKSLMTQKQYEGIHRDKLKYSYVKNHYDLDILYLWEHDINNNLQLCKELILFYIKNRGIIENYHSFNYELVDDVLNLKNKITTPYQDMPCSAYKNLLKNPA